MYISIHFNSIYNHYYTVLNDNIPKFGKYVYISKCYFNVTTIRLRRAYEWKWIKIDWTKSLHIINIEMDGL